MLSILISHFPTSDLRITAYSEVLILHLHPPTETHMTPRSVSPSHMASTPPSAAALSSAPDTHHHTFLLRSLSVLCMKVALLSQLSSCIRQSLLSLTLAHHLARSGIIQGSVFSLLLFPSHAPPHLLSKLQIPR